VRIGALRNRLVGRLAAELPDLRETVAVADKVAGSAHVCIGGIENEALLFLLDEGRCLRERGVRVRSRGHGALARAGRDGGSSASGPQVRCG
jgi:hypothetical protein